MCFYSKNEFQILSFFITFLGMSAYGKLQAF
jgi:hypothetical protein